MSRNTDLNFNKHNILNYFKINAYGTLTLILPFNLLMLIYFQ